VNSNFFANAKSNKDDAKGFAIDFANPAQEDQQLRQVMQESLASA